MGEEKTVKKVFGIINSITGKNTSTGGAMTKYEIDGKFYNFFANEERQSIDVNVGDYVEGTFYEKTNPSGAAPFKNVVMLTKTQKPEGYIAEEPVKKFPFKPGQPQKPFVPYQRKEENPEVFELGMAKNGATTIIAGMLSACSDGKQTEEALEAIMKKDMYRKLVNTLFEQNKLLRQELIKDPPKSE